MAPDDRVDLLAEALIAERDPGLPHNGAAVYARARDLLARLDDAALTQRLKQTTRARKRSRTL